MMCTQIQVLPLHPPVLPGNHVDSCLFCRCSYERHHQNHVQQSLYGRAPETSAALLPQDTEDGVDACSTHVHHEAQPRQHGQSMDRSSLTCFRTDADLLLFFIQLYELMVMAFKYQVFLCPRPKDLLLISYNHIDAVRELAKDTPAVVNHVDETHRRIMEVYSSLSEGEFQLLRQTLLIFFQDMNVRVSIFLKSQVQNPSGRFAMSTSGPVPHGIDVPGLIRLFNRTGREVRRSEFPTRGSYTSPIREGSLDLRGDRVIKLGTNMFTETHPEETKTSGAPSAKVRQLDETPNPLAKEELNLLARLMGSVKAENVPRTETGFRINLFPTEPEDEAAGAAGGAEGSMFEVINIQAVQDERAAAELAWIAGQFTDEEEHPENSSSSKGEDLLAMMDELRPTAEPNHQNQT
ncbi:protein OSCP1a isoform X2 [Takifugu rubripes]|uniref:protein OSCP1a isoform X2 n=1 Tax=Takifugu rubripes TaxID=31033 RepID=UPI0011454BD6|nr:protein OSCP1-like isoform X2 [Takifugu rubripes]